MAFVKKSGTQGSNGNFRNASDLAVGESITGFYLGMERAKYPYISLQLETGDKIGLNLTGNLNYFGTDTAEGKYVVGQLTRITRTGSRPNKRDATKQVGVFSVEQDPEKTVDVASVTNTTQTALQEKVKQMRQGK